MINRVSSISNKILRGTSLNSIGLILTIFVNLIVISQIVTGLDLEKLGIIALSAGLLVTVRGVPVFDISSYEGDVKKLRFHYLDKDGHITHELLDYGFYGQYQNIKQLQSDISPGFLEKSAKKQINALNKYFPMRSCQKNYGVIRAIL